ncbi:MarR family winged helix-turn-helix transcriptional regulator [Microbacterium murale]|uniref:DNA-binding MarR family transcriptional regulator n=1 Tax=Microbacterium murale TaxID=1081040 RepID=A0ABU0PCT5_9MICO|nr:MarR family transcriptional regulator [Microbacterium murale]MDQ0645149.1 DNA-binding MarR family transcriptional regulator [Microbacterium murale]
MSVTDEMLCFSLYSATRATTQAYRTLLAPWRLTYPQYLVLAVLWHDGEQTIRSLGEAMQLDSGTLSPLVRRLEQSGLVVKERNADDERVVTVSLTPEGLALRAELLPVHAEIAELAGIHDDAQRRRLIDELHALTALLQGVSARNDH